MVSFHLSIPMSCYHCYDYDCHYSMRCSYKAMNYWCRMKMMIQVKWVNWDDEPISFRVEFQRMSSGTLVLYRQTNRHVSVISIATKSVHPIYKPFSNCENVIERSLIWFWLGRMSRHGLLPMPIDDISAIRISRFRFACFHSNFDISSVHAFFMSSDILCSVHVSSGFRLRNQISNFGVSPMCAVKPMSDVLILFLYR